MEYKVANDGKSRRHVAIGEEGDSMTALASADFTSEEIKQCLNQG